MEQEKKLPSEIKTGSHHEIPEETFEMRLASIISNLLDVKLEPLLGLSGRISNLEQVISQALANFELATHEFHKLKTQGDANEQNISLLTERIDVLEKKIEGFEQQLTSLRASLEEARKLAWHGGGGYVR